MSKKPLINDSNNPLLHIGESNFNINQALTQPNYINDLLDKAPEEAISEKTPQANISKAPDTPQSPIPPSTAATPTFNHTLQENTLKKPIKSNTEQTIPKAKSTTSKGLLSDFTRQTLNIREATLEIIQALSTYTHKTQREILDILLLEAITKVDTDIKTKALKLHKELQKYRDVEILKPKED